MYWQKSGNQNRLAQFGLTRFIGAMALALVAIPGWATCYNPEHMADENYRRCREAADQGDAMAQYFVGQMYRKGEGTEQDPQRALDWYRKAAAAGNRLAMYNLGWMYDVGEGVPTDLGQAMSWYEKAARLGDQYAPFNIAAMYYSGQGVTKDLEKALLWFEVSILNGNQKGHKWKTKIVKDFSAEQLEASRKRLADWRAGNGRATDP